MSGPDNVDRNPIVKGSDNMNKKNQQATNCDDCMYLEYDDDFEDYVCTQSCLDEDDAARLGADPHYHCPYYRRGNEYTIVRKQI